jgi:hypothetical protein
MPDSINARPVSTLTNGHPRPLRAAIFRKPCGHTRHVGTCGCCQRAQLARWHEQLLQAQALRSA